MFQVYNPDNFQRDQGVTENVKYEKNSREMAGCSRRGSMRGRRGAIGTKRVKRHRFLYSQYTMVYRSAASIIRTKQNRIGPKTGIFCHSVPFQKKIELLFNPNESMLYLIRKTPIKSAKSSLLPPIF